jgi:hypothetical protein
LIDAGAAQLAYDKIDLAANMASIGEPLAALLASGETRDRMERALADRGNVDAALAIAKTLLK